MLVGLTTSGKSKNIERGFNVAKLKGVRTIRFTGKEAPVNKQIIDIDFRVSV